MDECKDSKWIEGMNAMDLEHRNTKWMKMMKKSEYGYKGPKWTWNRDDKNI